MFSVILDWRVGDGGELCSCGDCGLWGILMGDGWRWGPCGLGKACVLFLSCVDRSRACILSLRQLGQMQSIFFYA